MSDAYLKALKYIGKPYVWGKSDPDGYDCSGLLCIVTGIYKPRFSTRDPSNPPPPGDWERVTIPPGTTYKEFLKIVQEGDLFIWRGHHVAWYAGDERIYGAWTDDPQTPSGYSKAEKYFNELRDVEIQGYTSKKDGKWHAGHGLPEVWRQK